MEPPIWVYYELDGFHQNHRRYVKSRSNGQIEGRDEPTITHADLKSCDPAVEGDQERPLYPCGLVAHSVFNDSFALLVQGPGENTWENLTIDSSARTIAWPADVDGGRFNNYDPEANHPSGLQNQMLLDMWLYRRFPPVACVQKSIGLDDYRPVYVSTKEVDVPADPKTGRTATKVTVAACRDYMTDPKCDKFEDSKGNEVSCTGDYHQVPVADWGVKSGHFMVWMRVAGLPKFRKLWGKVDRRLVAGTRLKAYVASNFPVSSFEGKKALVISTSSALGGRNDFLGQGYLMVGVCCLVFGTWFLWKHLSAGSQ